MNEKTNQDIGSVFLDTAPVIYFVEKHPDYYPHLKPVFERFDNGIWKAFISPITIAESLVIPMRKGNLDVVKAFVELFENKNSVSCVSIQSTIARQAADIRSRQNLTLLDAFQVTLALENKCDVFLTNDKDLRRITEIKVLTVEQLDG